MEKVVATMKGEYGDEFVKVTGDVWNILIDNAEAEAISLWAGGVSL